MSLSEATDLGQGGEAKIELSVDALAAPKDWRATLGMLVSLFKLRIVFLLLMAATGGAFLAAEGWPDLGRLMLVWVTGGMAAAGASSLNQYLERRSDALMKRTQGRPLASGRLTDPRWVPIVGGLLILGPALAVFPSNPALSFFLLLGAFIYVVVYTIWLKPRTLLNIVIGGAAGSAAVLSGSAAAGAWNERGALLLALILFLWTPFHFWSLALRFRDDYQRAGVPMLPAQTSPRRAALWVMVHTAPTSVSGILLALLPSLGWLYLLPMILATAGLVRRNIKLIQDPSPANARSMFLGSNVYLLVLMLAICIDASLPYLDF
jgi:protoheme IX farnesyltransferase